MTRIILFFLSKMKEKKNTHISIVNPQNTRSIRTESLSPFCIFDTSEIYVTKNVIFVFFYSVLTFFGGVGNWVNISEPIAGTKMG